MDTNKIAQIQIDYTYEVAYKGHNYTVICIENLQEGYMEWNVYDDHGEDVEEIQVELCDEIIKFMIENT
jgi:hypothetical protein